MSRAGALQVFLLSSTRSRASRACPRRAGENQSNGGGIIYISGNVKSATFIMLFEKIRFTFRPGTPWGHPASASKRSEEGFGGARRRRDPAWNRNPRLGRWVQNPRRRRRPTRLASCRRDSNSARRGAAPGSRRPGTASGSRRAAPAVEREFLTAEGLLLLLALSQNDDYSRV